MRIFALSTALLVHLSLWSFGTIVNAQLLPPPAPGEYQLKGQFNYFTTSANYDEDGNKNSLENGSSLTTMQGSGEFIVDLTQNIRLQAGLIGGQTSVNRYSRIEDSSSTHTNIGVSEFWGRAQYWLKFWNFDVVPDVGIYYPLFRVDTNSGDPLLGEGATRFQGGGWLILDWTPVFPYAYAGYEYLDEGRASRLPYNVGVQWAPGTGWWLQTELRGFTSLTSDSDDAATRDDYLFNVQGGSERYFAMDPSANEAVLMGGAHFGQFGIYLGAAHHLTGRNTAHGITGFVGVTFDGTVFSSTPTYYSEPLDDGPPPEQRFRTKTETDDADLFDDTPATTPRPAAKPKVKKPPVRARARPVPKFGAPNSSEPLPSLELIMKDTQKSLEKRPPKK